MNLLIHESETSVIFPPSATVIKAGRSQDGCFGKPSSARDGFTRADVSGCPPRVGAGAWGR